MSEKSEPTIALVRQRYTAFGGAERFADRALRALAAQGTHVTLVTRSWQGDAPFEVVKCDPFYIGRLGRDRGFAACVRKHFAARHYDLVQSHERIPGCDIYRAGDGLHREWLAQRARVLGPVSRLLQRMNLYHRYVLRAERNLFLAERLRAVICNSRMVCDEIRRNFDVAEEKLHVIYNGVDTERFHPRLKAMHRAKMRDRLRIPEAAPVFLFVGSGFERKGAAALLRIFPNLPAEARLIIVGKDKDMRRYEDSIDDSSVVDRILFAGPQKEVGPYYGMADVLVLPTLYDPFPNVVVEAMACGLPVITSLKCGAAEMITTGVNGYVCDALDLGALRSAMIELISPERRQRMGDAARRTVASMSLDNMGRELVNLYEQLLAHGR